MNRTRVVGILGGMGPAAGADFARLFVQACADRMRVLQIPVSDQAFPEHWLAQVPVPDRSTALESPGLGGHQPLEPMLQAMGKLAALGATAVAVACNTAHAWHGALQERFPQLEVLHVAREVAHTLAGRGVKEVGLLATAGTYRAGLYDQALRQAGLQCHIPEPEERERLMHGIYHGVKVGNMALAHDCFAGVAEALARRHGLSTLVLGCTEIPLALGAQRVVAGLDGLDLIDPALLLARALARRAYATAA
ncbi:aspartate/glutamate racemase family protein [Polaromonas jejuensis]|uniref:Aspartate/glutamate racemase family protein n=1 Tax=Polaromonas jejuensis TaxID=457502 RepID=A0ABW0QIA7_9BURK|nr:amino acid racemase [Polaromonas jejuensis]